MIQKTKTLQSYSVYGVVTMEVEITIKAESFEDASLLIKGLSPTDFCKPLGGYNDGKLQIKGIFDNRIESI